MSRSNGPGAPPNGWPADYRPTEASDPYQDPYYTQQQRPAGPPPPQQQQVPPARAPRIQTAPTQSRVPQTGLPPNLAQGGPPQQGYAPAAYPGQQAPQAYGQPYTQQAQPPPQYAPPQHPQQYAQPQYAPQSQPQAYAPQQPQAPAYAPQHVQPQQPRTQPPTARQVPPQQPQNDPRFAPFSGFDAPPTARPAQPVQQPPQYPPAYTPAPSAYVPETTARPTQPPQQPQQPRAASPYDQQWQQPAPQQPAPPLADPRAYDLGHYQPSAAPAPPSEPRTQRPTAPPAWTPHAEPEARQHAADPGFAPQFQADAHGRHQPLEPVHDDEYEDHEDDEEYEDAPRKTRYGLIAASLIAAIAAGGGLAYAYKMYVAPPSQTAAAPVIKSNTGPIKVKPVDPGGTKFANTDSKMMENLSGSDTNSDGGPKQVKTMVIERDGSVASAQSAVPPPAAPAASVGVPGMILANVPPPPPRLPQAVQPAAVAAVVNPPVPQQQAPRAAPKVIATAPAPAAYPDPVDTAPAAAAPAAAPVKKIIPKKITPAAGPAPTAAPSAVGGPKGGNGFVAVLASVPASGSSRVEAMQQYADLQQKFGGVLGSKAPDVVEAKLPNGIYHRLIVGPPASRDNATTVCTQLKAAGYTADCWVTAF
ncbi:MAG: SPOR domain-containing protein [Hyphomicrobiaceae bacterium]